MARIRAYNSFSDLDDFIYDPARGYDDGMADEIRWAIEDAANEILTRVGTERRKMRDANRKAAFELYEETYKKYRKDFEQVYADLHAAYCEDVRKITEEGKALHQDLDNEITRRKRERVDQFDQEVHDAWQPYHDDLAALYDDYKNM